jgi:flagellar motility protein MotE (MotC chaperone)
MLLAGLVVLPFSTSAQQPKPGAGDAKPAKKPAAKEMPAFTPEREAAALTFVRTHHAELADLIAVLKEKHPKEYQRALRDLFRASERLAQIHDVDKGRYELELKAWKLQSRVVLLTARMTMEPSDKLRGDLRTALEQQYDNQLALVRAERDRAKQRIEMLEKQIDKLEQQKAEAIERQVETLSREAKKMNPKVKPLPAATGVK